MKKFNIILDDTTIINLPFFWKLMKRYMVISILTPILSLALGFYYYNSQNSIYLRSSSFKNSSDAVESPTSAIANLLGEKTSKLSSSEILGITTSIDFARRVAEDLLKDSSVYDMNFASITSKQNIFGKDYLGSCRGERDCELDRLQAALPSFYVLTEDMHVENRFWIQVKTLDKMTTEKILDLVVKNVRDSRIENTRHNLTEQLKISEELINKKKEELNNVDIASLKDELKSLNDQLVEVDRKTASFNQLYNQHKIKLTFAETKVKQTKSTIKKSISLDEKEAFATRTDLEEKLKRIQDDMTAIKLASKNLSNQDDQIILQLESEKNLVMKKIKALGNKGRSISNISDFLDEKDKSSDYDEFDYNVLKGQFEKISKDYFDLVEKRKVMMEQKISLENKLEVFKPSFEYIKLLENKTMQLKLLESTIVSDLIFDKELASTSVYKRASKSKILLFSFIVTLLLIFVMISIRYLFDDRIYDTYELQESFEDLAIIGNTPDFD